MAWAFAMVALTFASSNWRLSMVAFAMVALAFASSNWRLSMVAWAFEMVALAFAMVVSSALILLLA